MEQIVFDKDMVEINDDFCGVTFFDFGEHGIQFDIWIKIYNNEYFDWELLQLNLIRVV